MYTFNTTAWAVREFCAMTATLETRLLRQMRIELLIQQNEELSYRIPLTSTDMCVANV